MFVFSVGFGKVDVGGGVRFCDMDSGAAAGRVLFAGVTTQVDPVRTGRAACFGNPGGLPLGSRNQGTTRL